MLLERGLDTALIATPFEMTLDDMLQKMLQNMAIIAKLIFSLEVMMEGLHWTCLAALGGYRRMCEVILGEERKYIERVLAELESGHGRVPQVGD